jgi:hypothetical protein
MSAVRRLSCRSSINMSKSTGAKVDPWGTPFDKCVE